MSEYLDRKQVIELYEKYHSHLATYVWEFWQELGQLPIVEQRPHGEWIWNTDNHYAQRRYCKCSICGIGMGNTEYDFCPNCGADMRKEGDSDA